MATNPQLPLLLPTSKFIGQDSQHSTTNRENISIGGESTFFLRYISSSFLSENGRDVNGDLCKLDGWLTRHVYLIYTQIHSYPKHCLNENHSITRLSQVFTFCSSLEDGILYILVEGKRASFRCHVPILQNR